MVLSTRNQQRALAEGKIHSMDELVLAHEQTSCGVELQVSVSTETYRKAKGESARERERERESER
jgi:hypothetical protein